MGIISWIILGLIAGFIGSKIVDSQGQGFWLNIALGICRCSHRRISIWSLWGVGRYWAEYLQHDRCHRWINRGAVDLQRADRSSPSLMHNRNQQPTT